MEVIEEFKGSVDKVKLKEVIDAKQLQTTTILVVNFVKISFILQLTNFLRSHFRFSQYKNIIIHSWQSPIGGPLKTH